MNRLLFTVFFLFLIFMFSMACLAVYQNTQACSIAFLPAGLFGVTPLDTTHVSGGMRTACGFVSPFILNFCADKLGRGINLTASSLT